MKISVYRQKLRDAFFKRLEQKTGWGKELVKREFEEASEEVILEMLEEEESSIKCNTCGSTGFKRSKTMKWGCEFCDGTVAGQTQ